MFILKERTPAGGLRASQGTFSSKSKISSLYLYSVFVQPGLCRTWSETPKTGFLTTRLN